jgi:SOS response regulatory protein OraA/RecX
MPKDYKLWARQARFLQQRGFTANEIRSFKD